MISSDPAEAGAWWASFGDPTLNGLIAQARQQNLDLRTAGTRIIEAQAQRGVAIGNLFPQRQTAVLDYAHVQTPGISALPFPHTLSIWATGFNASWEVDFRAGCGG